MSEAQKYQGALYKEKPSKGPKRKKAVTIAEDPVEKPSLQPYVEDAPDIDDTQPSKSAPPTAPSPPPAAKSTSRDAPKKPATKEEAVNVFDFLDPADERNASKVSLGGTKEQMKMVHDAPKLFEPPKQLAQIPNSHGDDSHNYDVAYEENGFSYGSGPIPPSFYTVDSNRSMDFMTPGNDRSQGGQSSFLHSFDSRNETIKPYSDKKRKRSNPKRIETPAHQTSFGADISMADAPSSTVVNPPITPSLQHSGLTGGLSKMMKYSESPESSDYRGDRDYHNGESIAHPTSPVKRTRRGNKESSVESGLGISVKNRSGKLISVVGGGATGVITVPGTNNDPTFKAFTRSRRRGSLDTEKEQEIHIRKHKRSTTQHSESRKPSKSHHHEAPALNEDGDWADYHKEPPQLPRLAGFRRHRDSDDRSRSPRPSTSNADTFETHSTIYKHGNDGADDVVTRQRARAFLASINKGPESGKGYSVHKILKRFYREQASSVISDDTTERGGRSRRTNRGGDRDKKEEEELWRMLRLKKNDRGEVVLFLHE
ncbi:hypothetical protein LOZ53_000180 [Ophidiomyces ophidiicola]|uniref:Uncharacterized protein n=1 Tax=Ophidiomyces ophidiicola TaxID=1387563 RepID=A0ACB8UWI8_9EURO|nr:hypothetical protein LOZ64_002242 [Ophidiomyces ophidiicola]KAI1955274.1 hypothetical protein LOZ62_000400 [Ophidiomyces ophidiicola]KAI1967425.1 hypothetical protein LOZ59_000795 [Ophidiomyces ophidiicola]KAI1974752.1 hypothetical protein LOZ56_001052 [Ophidiomyces ophidiicola]KAI1997775.1 hypothetical protein LOZ53_000180 [Ophidiomyces ophidiicola]